MSRRIRSVILGALGGALAACSDDVADPHGHADVLDAASLDRPDATADSLDAPAADEATTDAAPDASAATCSPPCDAGQICCTDQHGHFPTCRAGNTCTDAGAS